MRTTCCFPPPVATGSTSLAARSGVSSFQRTDPNGRSSMRRTRTGSGPRWKAIALLMQRALRLGRAVALAQIIEPGRAVIALGPQFGIGDVARDRPAIGAVALAAELHFLHHIVEGAGVVLRDAVFDLDHQGPAAPGQRQPHFGIGQHFGGCLVARADRRHPQPYAEQRREQASGRRTPAARSPRRQGR